MQHDGEEWEDGRAEVHIGVVAKSKTDTLRETVNFLYDLNVAYELARLASDRRYSDFTFSHNVWMRNGRPLEREAQLRVVTLRETSPIELIVAIGAISVSALTSIWLLVQIIEKAYNLPMARRKLVAETEKAERENRLAKKGEDRNPEQHATELLHDSHAAPYLQNVTRRLSQSTVIVKELTVHYVEQKQK